MAFFKGAGKKFQGKFGSDRGGFKKPAFGDRPHRSGFGGGKPWERAGSGRPEGMTMHQATCAKCGKSCEVPFKPNGKKPVYCKDCFVRDDAGQDRQDRGERREFTPRPEFARPQREFTASKPAAMSDETKKHIDALNVKIDGLIKSVDYVVSLVRTIQTQTEKSAIAEAPKKETVAAVKKSIKKPAKKK